MSIRKRRQPLSLTRRDEIHHQPGERGLRQRRLRLGAVGGQAVLEGVMMRSPSSWSVAIRTPEGDITEVVREISSPMQRRRIWRLPVIRGVVALGESLAIEHHPRVTTAASLVSF